MAKKRREVKTAGTPELNGKASFIGRFVKFNFPKDGDYEIVFEVTSDQWNSIKDMPEDFKGEYLTVLVVKQ